MSSLEIKSSNGAYSIFFDQSAGNFEKEIEFLVVDSNICPDVWPVSKHTFVIEAIEANKTIGSAVSIIEAMAGVGLTRSSELHAVGGGLIQDLATLASSLYKRGIQWAYWPTTLTGMLDSCVGGKSSINVGKHKNLIGNFHPPKEIYLDTSFIETLPLDQVLSGLAEGIKICYARGDRFFEEFLTLAPDGALLRGDTAKDLAMLCLEAKKWFVEVDEYDKKERLLLNFGHSFGHAFESATDYEVPHGIAVALGMLAEIRFSKNTEHEKTTRLVTYCFKLLQSWRSYKQTPISINWEVFALSLAADKKNTLTALNLVVPSSTSSLSLMQFAFKEGSIDFATEIMRGVADEVFN
jgi:3-dehydroquinate synthase